MANPLNDVMAKKTKISLKISFLVFCVFGFIYQVTEVSLIYFKYETSTATKFILYSSRPLPNLAVCFPREELIDIKKVRNSSRITVREFFDYTPGSSSFKSITYRRRGNYLLKNVSDIQSVASIDKFLVEDWLCNRFIWKNETPVDHITFDRSIMSPGVLYSLSMDPSQISAATRVKVIPFYGNYPLLSRTYTGFAEIKGKSSNNNLFSVKSSLINIFLLPSPHDTHCKYASNINKWCRDSCITRKTIHAFGKQPFQLVTHQASDLEMMSQKDLEQNQTLTSQLYDIHDQCVTGLCHDMPCKFDFLTTIFHQSHASTANDFRITVLSDTEPEKRLTSQPKLVLVEYIVYICSCFGIWFGLSVIQLNPFKVMVIMKTELSNNRVSTAPNASYLASTLAAGTLTAGTQTNSCHEN